MGKVKRPPEVTQPVTVQSVAAKPIADIGVQPTKDCFTQMFTCKHYLGRWGQWSLLSQGYFRWQEMKTFAYVDEEQGQQ